MNAIQPIIPCNAVPQGAWNNVAGTTIEHMLVTGYYDGATGGFVQCSAISPIYHFVTLYWSQSHTIRVIALSLVPADSWAKLTSFFSEKPQGGQWIPKILQRPSDEDLDRIERFLSEIVARAEPPSVVLAWNISTNEILAARQVGPISPDHLVNMFDLDDVRTARDTYDWFADLGVARDK
jgi:hypothetical protein